MKNRPKDTTSVQEERNAAKGSLAGAPVKG